MNEPDTISRFEVYITLEKHMQIHLNNLTAQEHADWEQFLTWYNQNGWVGDEARRVAWTDLQRKHPRLHAFSDVEQDQAV